MITLANRTEFLKEYNCITADITANKHLPDSDGKSNINGIIDLNGRIGLMFGTAGVRYVASFSYPVSESNKTDKYRVV